MKVIESKKGTGVCAAYRCGKSSAAKDYLCHKHRKRLQKETNPLVYCYGYLKQNAKRRGKSFELSIEEFKQFCEETGYLELKGKAGNSASIDRIDPSRGYSLDNIQVLSLADNSRKAHDDKNNYPF